MELTIRQRRQKVAACIKTKVQQSLQNIADAAGLSKSSVYRHQQGIERRQQYPESSFWESEVGYQWLVRLVFGVIYWALLNSSMILRKSERDSSISSYRFIPRISNAV